MLPFLKHKKDASSASSSEPVMRKPDDGSEYDPMHSAASDLKEALSSGNIQAIADSLRAAFQLCGSESHEEGE